MPVAQLVKMSFRAIFFPFIFFSVVWAQKPPQTDTSFQQHKGGVHGHACVKGVLQCRESGDPKVAGAETVVKTERKCDAQVLQWIRPNLDLGSQDGGP